MNNQKIPSTKLGSLTRTPKISSKRKFDERYTGILKTSIPPLYPHLLAQFILDVQ